MDFIVNKLIRYNKKTVADELKRIWRLLGKKSFTYTEFREAGGKVTDVTVRKFYGTWNNGLRESGIPIARKMNLSDEELMSEFHNVVKKFKRKPTYNEFKSDSKYSINVYVRKYGSYLKACYRYIDWLSPEGGKFSEQEYIQKPKTNKTTKRSTLTRSLRFDVFLRDNFVCQYCGNHPPNIKLEVDHITPVSEGGSNNLNNLIRLSRNLQ